MGRSIRVDVTERSHARVNVTITLLEDGKPLLLKRFSRNNVDGKLIDQTASLMLLDGVKTQVENWLNLVPLFDL